MIEPTDEMIADAMEAYNSTGAYGPVVAAVLAIVERDYRVVQRCTDVECERSAGHRASHGCFDGREWVDW